MLSMGQNNLGFLSTNKRLTSLRKIAKLLSTRPIFALRMVQGPTLSKRGDQAARSQVSSQQFVIRNNS